jgi:hypothetical protein
VSGAFSGSRVTALNSRPLLSPSTPCAHLPGTPKLARPLTPVTLASPALAVYPILQDVGQRTQMVLDRIAFEADPEAFLQSHQEEQDKLTAKLQAARERLPKCVPRAGPGRARLSALEAPSPLRVRRSDPQNMRLRPATSTSPHARPAPPRAAPRLRPSPAPRVKIARDLQVLISDVCSRLDVDGLRGDLVVNRAAKALVAFEGRDTVTQEDVGRVISSCLNHRCGWQRRRRRAMGEGRGLWPRGVAVGGLGGALL